MIGESVKDGYIMYDYGSDPLEATGGRCKDDVEAVIATLVPLRMCKRDVANAIIMRMRQLKTKEVAASAEDLSYDKTALMNENNINYVGSFTSSMCSNHCDPPEQVVTDVKDEHGMIHKDQMVTFTPEQRRDSYFEQVSEWFEKHHLGLFEDDWKSFQQDIQQINSQRIAANHKQNGENEEGVQSLRDEIKHLRDTIKERPAPEDSAVDISEQPPLRRQFPGSKSDPDSSRDSKGKGKGKGNERYKTEDGLFNRCKGLCREALHGRPCSDTQCKWSHPHSLSEHAYQHVRIWFRSVRDDKLTCKDINENWKKYHVAKGTWDENKAKNPSDTEEFPN